MTNSIISPFRGMVISAVLGVALAVSVDYYLTKILPVRVLERIPPDPTMDEALMNEKMAELAPQFPQYKAQKYPDIASQLVGESIRQTRNDEISRNHRETARYLLQEPWLKLKREEYRRQDSQIESFSTILGGLIGLVFVVCSFQWLRLDVIPFLTFVVKRFSSQLGIRPGIKQLGGGVDEILHGWRLGRAEKEIKRAQTLRESGILTEQEYQSICDNVRNKIKKQE